MQFTIKDKTFSAGLMPAIKQFHVVRRLTPLVDAAKDMLDDKAVKRLMEGGKTEDVQLSDFHLGPIASVLASLPDADFEYVVNACLDVTELKQPDGGFAPVRVKGVVMFPFDLSTLIGIVWNVLKGNLPVFSETSARLCPPRGRRRRRMGKPSHRRGLDHAAGHPGGMPV